MQKFKIHIPAHTADEMAKELEQAAYILTGLFESVSLADKSYGGPAVMNKNYWKSKAEKWVNERKVIIDGEK